MAFHIQKRKLACRTLYKKKQLNTKLYHIHIKKNSMVRVREQTIPTERPPLVGEVIANFCGLEGATWSA
jgi:hypothetical protein